jgi:hypothetical protein
MIFRLVMHGVSTPSSPTAVYVHAHVRIGAGVRGVFVGCCTDSSSVNQLDACREKA